MINLDFSPSDAILVLGLAAARYEEYAAEAQDKASIAYYLRKASKWREQAKDIEDDYFPVYC